MQFLPITTKATTLYKKGITLSKIKWEIVNKNKLKIRKLTKTKSRFQMQF